MSSSVLSFIARAIEYLGNPRLIQARRLGIRVDFVTELLELQEVYGFLPRSVVDAGANRGEFIRAVDFVYTEVKVLAFEPLPRLVGSLRAEFEGPNCEIFPLALADTNGSRNFFLPQGQNELSSLLRPTRVLDRVFRLEEKASETPAVTVQVARLDDCVCLADYPRPIMLKLDVQGAEMTALRGAANSLASINVIKLEWNFDRLYSGQGHLHELFELLSRAGFTRFLQRDVHVWGKKASWCDLIFFKE